MTDVGDPRSPAIADDSDANAAPLAPAEEQRWLDALRVAWAPAALSAARHERILQDALEDPFAPASEEERAAAEALRRALDEQGDHEHAALARALGHAASTTRGEPEVSERALARALSKPSARSNLILVTFGVAASGLALAAAVALVVGSSRQPAPAVARTELLPSRSLAPLLSADAAEMSASERMDRVASVRGKELRQNRYAAWGVR